MNGLLAALPVAAVFLAACSPPPAPAKFSYQYQFYRFDDRVGEAAAVDGPGEAPDSRGVKLSFDTDSAEQWTSDSGKGHVEATGSSVVFRCDEADTLVSPAGLGIDGTSTKSLVLRMRVSGPSVVTMMWLPPDAKKLWFHRSLRIHVGRQDKMVTYNLNVAAVQAWRMPRIDRLRFSVDSAATLEIQSLQSVTTAASFTGAAAGTVNFPVGDDVRPSLFNRCPGYVDYVVKVPPQGAFTAGLAVLKPDEPVQFELNVLADGKAETLLSQTVARADQWKEVSADLSSYSGREVTLRLSASSGTAGQVAMWGNPIMYRRFDPGAQTGARPPNVLLYVVDCMRADHLECYGYARETMPNVAALAREGVRFARCYAQDTWTKSSMTSLATGVDQVRHGVEQYGDLVPSALVMLPELLRKNGYETCVVTENPHTPPESIGRSAYSFIVLDPVLIKGTAEELASLKPEVTYKNAADFMEMNRDKPFFLYVHAMEAHDTNCPERPCDELLYSPPASYKNMFAQPAGQKPMDLYDAALAFADADFRRVLDKLDELGIANDTVVILTADHGEAFAEHEAYNGHAWKTFNTLLHVPLVIRYPGVFSGGATVNSNVQLNDLSPTLLHLLGLPEEPQFEGASLVELAKGNQESFESRMIFSKWFGSVSLIQSDWKLMYDFSLNEGKLFNIIDDPGETTDVTGKNPRVARRLNKLLHEHIAHQEARHAELADDKESSAVGIDPRLQEQLEGLGYLGNK